MFDRGLQLSIGRLLDDKTFQDYLNDADALKPSIEENTDALKKVEEKLDSLPGEIAGLVEELGTFRINRGTQSITSDSRDVANDAEYERLRADAQRKADEEKRKELEADAAGRIAKLGEQKAAADAPHVQANEEMEAKKRELVANQKSLVRERAGVSSPVAAREIDRRIGENNAALAKLARDQGAIVDILARNESILVEHVTKVNRDLERQRSVYLHNGK